MNSLLARNSRDDKSVEVRRLIVLAAVIIVLSGAWHGLRGTLVRAFGASSIGCYGRDALVRGALRQAGYDIADDEQLHSHSLPRPGWAAWSKAVEIEILSDGSRHPTRWQTTIVDGRLRLLGKLSTGIDEPPMDLDGDGRWEVRVGALVSEPASDAFVGYYAVLRLGASANEIIWLGLYDDSAWRARKIRVYPRWQDTDGDDVQELVFITVVITRSATGGIAFQPPQIVASFKLDHPGGMMWPASMPADCGITSWDPPGGAPVCVEQDADLGALFRELLPLPESSP
ncbi:MAG: hypothetical protein PVJ57_14860 [Phycisphaerae bacterium]|jgi:hypothetical protein